jgi:hypothetical protein
LTDSEKRNHSVEITELQQKHNAELILLRKKVSLELEKLQLYITHTDKIESETVKRLITRALDRLG